MFALFALATTARASSLSTARRQARQARLVDARASSLERRLQKQGTVLERLEERTADLERVAVKEFEILHYNVLSNYSATNMLPWFCYGCNVTAAERAEMHRRFYAPGPTGFKRVRGKGWPTWAEEVLSPERRAAVEAYDALHFGWERRCERLIAAVCRHRVGCRERAPDILTLAECDCYDEFWRERLLQRGYASTWRKRPRSSIDGCAIAWRSSTFELLASGGYDFGSALSRSPDRTCHFALLAWRRDPTVRLLVATTHLARNPESDEQLLARGYQYGSLFRELLAFAAAHGAEDVPVVLTGDLNAKDCDELAGIARALVRLLSTPTHPLLWSVLDAPTPATTVTEERTLRIDYVLYQSESLSLTGVSQLPTLDAPIPDAEHPSDHLPVSARLVVRPHWARVEDDARQWLACVSSNTAVRPLSGDALRTAFTYFDKDGSGLISLVQLEAGLQSLGFPGLDSSKVREALRAAGCETSAGESRSLHPHLAWISRRATDDRSWAMDLDQFVHVYTHFAQQATAASSSARQLDLAFKALNPNHSGVVSRHELQQALRSMCSAPLDEPRVEAVLRELEDGAGTISLASFTNWMMGRYTSSLEDPSIIADSMSKVPNYGDLWPQEVYNQ